MKFLINSLASFIVDWLSSLTHKPNKRQRIQGLSFSLRHFNSPKIYLPK